MQAVHHSNLCRGIRQISSKYNSPEVAVVVVVVVVVVAVVVVLVLVVVPVVWLWPRQQDLGRISGAIALGTTHRSGQ